METKTQIVQIHVEPNLIKKIKQLQWAKNQSDAIRTIVESFFKLGKNRQQEIISKTNAEKFTDP